MTDLNLPGGLTDGPPAVLSGTQLAHQWLDGGREPEWRASDGSAVYRFAVIDFDYLMGYLLRVTAPKTGVVDLLAVFVRHGRHPDRGWDLDAEWHQVPRRFFDGDPEWLADGHHWFVDWTFGRAEDYGERMRQR